MPRQLIGLETLVCIFLVFTGCVVVNNDEHPSGKQTGHIRHAVLFQWKADTPPSKVAEIENVFRIRRDLRRDREFTERAVTKAVIVGTIEPRFKGKRAVLAEVVDGTNTTGKPSVGRIAGNAVIAFFVEHDRLIRRKHVEEHFTVDTMTEGYIRIHEKTLKR